MARPKGTTSPQLLNPEVQAAICASLAKSVPEKYAAEAQGISERLFHQWMAKGNDGVEPYASFASAVTQARARAVEGLIDKATADKGSSQATWLLERRYRKEFGPIQKIELGGDPDGVPLRVEAELDKLSAEDLRRIASD